MPQIDPAIDAAVSGALGAPPTKSPIFTPDDAVAQVLGEDNAYQALTLRGNLLASNGANPDAEAQVTHLSRFLSVPPDSVRAEPAQVRGTAAQQMFDATSLVQNSAATANLLSQQQNMRMLHDDIPNVAATEQAVKGIAAVNQRGSFADVASGVMSTEDKIHAALIRGQLALQQFLPKWLQSTPDQQAENMELGGQVSDAAATEAPRTLPGQVAAGLTYAPLAPLPGGIGLTTAAVVGSEGVALDQELLGKGVDPDAARLAASIGGGLQGLIQLIPSGGITGGVASRAAIAQLVKTGAISTAKAAGLGAAQAAIGDSATYDVIQGSDRPDLADEYAPSVAKTLQGAAFNAGLHIGTSAIHAGLDYEGNPTPETQTQKAQDTNAASALLQKLGQVATGGKFRERDPEGFHQFVSDVADANNAPDLYVDARTLSNVLDEAGVSGDAFRAQMPDVAAQMREALQTEGQVRMSLADYATHVAGGPVDELLQPHLRTDPAGMTFAEAKAHADSQANGLAADTENIQNATPDDDFSAASARQVETTIRQQLDDANRFPPDVNEAYAKLATAYYTTTAARAGVLPHELLEQHPLNIQAEGTKVGGEDGFGQGSAPDGWSSVGPGDSPANMPPGKQSKGIYSPASNTISLMKNADLATFLHEAGHHFLETHARIASEEGAPEDIKADVQHLMDQAGHTGSVADWLALPGDARRDAHENFARGFEAYLLEGKAPSTELQPLFARFRSWLVQIYKSAASLRVSLSDDVRQIMDRMIATDETIRQAQAVRGMAPMFDLKPEGMSEEQFLAYRDVAGQATTEAVDTLQTKSLKDMQWLSRAKSAALKALQAKADGAREAIRDEVTREVDATPTFQAKAFLDEKSDPNFEHKQAMTEWRDARDAVPKAQREQWVSEHPAPARPRTDLDDWQDSRDAEAQKVRDAAGQRAMEGKEGLERGQALQRASRAISHEVEGHMIEWEKSNPKPKVERIVPDLETTADRFGFNSADEMLQSIRDAGSRDDIINAATDQRMLQRHGELVDPVSIDRAADAAIHNDVRSRLIATELRALMKATGGSPGLLAKAAKEAAEASVASKTVGQLRVAQYAIAEGKAARAAAKAFRAGDLKEAAIQKRAQLLNNALEKAAREARDDVQAGLKYQAKFDKAETRKRLDGQFLTRIDEIRGLVDFRKNPPSFNRGKANLQTWADGLRDAGEEPQISEWLGQLEAPQSYKTMTVEQFRGTVAAIKSLEFIARARQEVTVEGKRLALRDVIDNQLIPRMDERGEKFSKQDLVEPPRAKIDGYWAALTHWLSVHMRLVDADLKPQEFKFNKYDLHELDGPFRKALLDPFLDANYLKVDLTKEVSDHAGAVGKELGKGWQKALYDVVPNRLLHDPDLSGFNAPVPMKITRGRMLGIARHVGNESNFDKLVKGYGWAPADVWSFLRQNMAAKDWRATQAHWDSFEPLWKRTVDMVKRIGGVAPPKIAAREFQITTPDGEKIQMRGGYSPIDYDPLRSKLSVQKGEFSLDPGDKVSEMPMYRATTTSNGSLTNRAQGYTDRVSLDFHSSDARIRDTIHDLAYREALLDATKVVNDDAFREKFQKVYGREEFQALTTWLKNVRDTNVEDPRTRNFDKAMQYARQGIVINGIGYRVSTVLKHGSAAALKSLGYLGTADGAGYFAARVARMGSGHASEDIAAAKEKFGEIRTRALQMDRDYKVGSQSMYEAEDWRAKNDRFGHAMVAWSDLLSAVPTAWAAYDLATTKGIPESMGGTGEPMTEDQAVKYANSIVRQAHGSALEVTRSNFLQARGAKGFFGALYGFMNNTYGQMGDLLDKSVSGGHFKNNPAVAARLFATFIVPAVLAAWIKNGGPDDKKHESYAAWFAKALVGEAAATGPVVRESWDVLEGMLDGARHESSTAITQIVGDALKSGKDLWDEAHGKSSRIVQDLTNAIGEWFHIGGAGQLGHILQHMRDVVNGKTPEDPNPVMEAKKTVM